jgi:polar amino acid transport system substrate-binding protein
MTASSVLHDVSTRPVPSVPGARRWPGCIMVTAIGLTIALSACGSGGASSGGSAAGSGSHSKVQVASSALLSGGQITYCSDISFPPFEYYLSQGKPAGSDIDLGDALATTMGLHPIWRNVSFNGIIPALQAKQCDAIISGLFDKPSRRKVVDFVDYISIGNTLVVPSGNPGGVTSFASLSGQKVGAESGSTLAQELDVANKELAAQGKKPMTVITYPTDAAALEQLLVKHLAAYYTATSTAAYYSKLHPGQIQRAGPVTSAFKAGIATLKNNSALHDAFVKALAVLRQNGTYTHILSRWNLQADAVK